MPLAIPRVRGRYQAHRDRPEDERVHCVEEARPGAAGPRIGRLRFGDDRLHLRSNGRHFLAVLKLQQFELCLVPRLRVGDDLVEQLRNRSDNRFQN
jgi:hypothetical protein